MRVLELRDRTPDGVQLDLHPRLSVISGLRGPVRDRILAALAALPGLEAQEALTAVSGLIEAHGILLDLDPTSLALLDLCADLDVVVRRQDLDELAHGQSLGAAGREPSTPPGLTVEQAQQAYRSTGATHDLLRQSVQGLEDEHRRVLARRSTLALALSELGVDPTTAAGVARSTPTGPSHDAPPAPAPAPAPAAARTATAVLEGSGPTPEAVAAIAAAAARVDRLRTRRGEVLAELEPLADLDSSAVEAALAAVSRSRDQLAVPDPVAAALADELVAAAAALEAFDARIEASGQGPLAAYRRLDEAQRRFLAAEAAVKPPQIDPAEARALEAAHDELLAAELRLGAARLPSKNLRKRLDDAVDAEREILERMGFATYTAFVMSTTAPIVSPELRAAHEQSQEAYAQAEAAFLEVTAAVERDPERAALVVALDARRERAQSLVGPVHDSELESTLRAQTVVDEAHAAEAARAIDAVRGALEEAGVDFGDLSLSDDEIVDVATVWLADMEEAAHRRGELEEVLQALEDEIAGAEIDLSQLETSAPTLEDLDAQDDPVAVPSASPAEAGPELDEEAVTSDEDLARADLEVSFAEVAAEAAALEEQIDAQRSLLEASAAAMAGARAAVAAAEERARTNDDASSAPTEPTPAGGGSITNLEQVEWYLLARLAAQRCVSYAGSVPLVLDDPLTGLADEDVSYVMDRLLRMTDAVQVIFVGDDPRVVRWGRDAGEQVETLVLH